MILKDKSKDIMSCNSENVFWQLGKKCLQAVWYSGSTIQITRQT
jgi:hypothetical protein